MLMTDRLFAARDVIKVNALNIDAFDAPESGPLGYIAGEDVIILKPCQRNSAAPCPIIHTDVLEENVPVARLLYRHGWESC